MKIQGSCQCAAIQFEVESKTPYPFMHCYCSICRKLGGGGGYVVNIMAEAKTLKVLQGEKEITRYHAMQWEKGVESKASSERGFCRRCGSYLWLFSSDYPDWIYPFASAIDTPLPKPPEIISLMTEFAASWVDIPENKQALKYDKYPDLSIMDWHKKHNLLEK